MTGPRTRIAVAGVLLSFVLALVIGISGVVARGGTVALGASTTLTVLAGEVLVSHSGDAFTAARDGSVLGPGDVIRTGVDGRAVLTYFEGSTVTLEPDAEMRIDEASSSPDGSTVVAMTQNLGRTWHVVTKLITGGSKYEVRTPAATASVRGTAFEVGVTQDAAGAAVMRVSTTEGAVATAALPTPQDPTPDPVVVAAGFTTAARAGERKPDVPTLMPQPERKITVNVGAPDALVIDPLGRANGFKDGKRVLQTPGAEVVRLAGTVVVTLPNMPDGRIKTVVPGGSDVPVITTVRDHGRPAAIVQDSLAADDAVSGLEVRAGEGARAPEVRRLRGDEKKELPEAKVGKAPETEQRPVFRPGLADPIVLRRIAEQRRGDETRGRERNVKEPRRSDGRTPGSDPRGADETPGGFVPSLPLMPSPLGADELRRASEQEQQRAAEELTAAEELERAAREAREQAEQERGKSEAARLRAEEERKQAEERARVAEEEKKKAEAAKNEAAAREAAQRQQLAQEQQRLAEEERTRREDELRRIEQAQRAATELQRQAAEDAKRAAERVNKQDVGGDANETLPSGSTGTGTGQ